MTPVRFGRHAVPWASCVLAGVLWFDTQAWAQACPMPDFSTAVVAGTTDVTRGVLKAVDYNADGKPDLAYLKTPRVIEVLLGSGGSFTVGSSVDVGVAITDFTFVDLNRDGRMDLVVTDAAGLRTYLQRPDGSLGVFTLPRIPETLPGSTAAYGQVVAADFSRDGLPDLAVVNLGARRLEFHTGDATGVMTYQPPAADDHRLEGSMMWGLALGFDGVAPIAGAAEPGERGSSGRVLVQGFWRTQSSNANVGALHGPLNLAAADLDGDGISDWIVNERGDGYLSIYSKGARVSSVKVDPRINELAAGDFNADGKPDVVLALDNNGLAIAAGNGQGGLQPLQRFLPSFAPSAVVAADFDQDGIADVAIHADNTGQVVLLTNRCAPDRPKVDAVAMDVAQTVNDLGLSVPLVAGKRTFVRLYATSTVPLSGVSARLRGFGASGTSLGPALAPLNEQLGLVLGAGFSRQRVADGYLFELPADWLSVGSLRLEGTVNDPTGIPLAAGSSTTLTRTVDLLPVPALPVTLYDVTWRSKGKPATNRSGDAAEALWRISRQFPTPAISATVKPIDIAWDDNGFLLGPDYLEPLLDELHLTYFDTPPAKSLRYFLIGASGGGLASGIGGSTALGSVRTITHELGHLLGLRHVNASVNVAGRPCQTPPGSLATFPYEDGRIGGPTSDAERFVGFDAGAIAAARSDTTESPADVVISATRETMSYCEGARWFSDLSQRIMLQAVTDRFRTIRRLPAPMNADTDAGLWLSLQASVDAAEDRVVGLRARRFPAALGAPEVLGDGYRLRFLDAAGNLVAETPFGSQPPLEGGRHRSLSIVVRWPDGAAAFRLVHDASQTVLAERRVPAVAPRIRSLTVTPNAGRLELRWAADGGSGRPMRYWLSYRPVTTQPWRPVVVDLPDSATSVPLDRIEGTHGAPTGQFRLQALDELDTAEAVSTPFAVPGKPPVLSVASPANGLSLRPGQSVTLQAAAWDADDGALAPSAITWVSDRDGLVGTGGLVTFTPRASGLHRLTASVVDSDGQRTTQQRLVDASGTAGTLVTCIVAGNRIEAVGGHDLLGRTWRRTIAQAATDILAGARYAVAGAGGSSARIAAVRTRRGTTYLRAVPSRGLGDNLRGLPTCGAS